MNYNYLKDDRLRRSYDGSSSMKNEIQRHNYSISAIRMIALVFIITCHIMQFLDFELAWWFNVGVQIFLCISGYLYGQKKSEDLTLFYYRRFKKILIPYYIVYIVSGIIEFIFARDYFNVLRFGGGFVCRTTIAGGEHLWFVPVILFCYVITPILNSYRDKYINSEKSLWTGTILSVFVVSVFGSLYGSFFNPARLSCYVIGYAIGINEDKKLLNEKWLFYIFGVACLLGNGIQLYCDYVSRISLPGYYATAYRYFQNYNHVCLGVFLFLVMKRMFKYVTFGACFLKLLKTTDNYSYEIYLVHQFLILGPFSLMALTPILPFNIAIIVIGIGILAWVLKRFENMIITKLS